MIGVLGQASFGSSQDFLSHDLNLCRARRIVQQCLHLTLEAHDVDLRYRTILSFEHSSVQYVGPSRVSLKSKAPSIIAAACWP